MMSTFEEIKRNLRSWFSFGEVQSNLEKRYGFSFGDVKEWAVRGILGRPVPETWGWAHYLGPTIVFLFIVQVITGIALCFYYKPTPDEAHLSIKYIMNQVPYGWLIRSIHSWAANLLVLSLFLHLVRIFAVRAYANPRELTWIVGAVNFALVIALGFTGFLLPWDQNSYWATAVLTSEVKDLPWTGRYLQLFLRGGEEVGSGTLTRFFIYHILLFSGALFLCIVFHIAMVWRQGITVTPHPYPSPQWGEGRVRGIRKVFPHFALDAGIILFLLFALLLGLAVFLPSELPEAANPALAPKVIKPEWYLLSLYQFYKVLPGRIIFIPRAAVFIGLCAVGAVLFFFLPFYDVVEKHRRSIRIGGIAAALAFVVFTLWGLLS